MKTLLTVSAVIEFGAGLALLCCPSTAIAFLGSAPLEGPATLTVTRVGGAGLLSLSVACWLARDDIHSRAARGLTAAMGLYNVSTVSLLTCAGIGLRLHGIALWVGVGLHTVMAAWCAACLLYGPLRAPDSNP